MPRDRDGHEEKKWGVLGAGGRPVACDTGAEFALRLRELFPLPLTDCTSTSDARELGKSVTKKKRVREKRGGTT
jgi:hypothetical protein